VSGAAGSIHLALPDEDATARCAELVAAALEPGDVVTLAGEVGAGKTTFVRAAARVLGVREPVRSPTYTVAHVYHVEGGGSVAHLDLYRSGGLDAASFADIEPTFDAVASFVEWADPLAGWLDERPTWRLELRAAGATARVLVVCPPDRPRLDALVRGLAELVP
jgi:tRNA threonylcarbamoyladenosine biosynthesis protein TsaE